jgi:allophanate hydrolase
MIDDVQIRTARDAAEKCEQPAFISVLDADQVEAMISAAPEDGPLAGLPFAVKDNIDVLGVPTTGANPATVNPATSHATAVARLIAAGAVPIGKTNLDQYATGLVGTRSPYGACHSVFSDRHVSGGSSSGSAIAVAEGIVPFALATDTAGSGRVPAGFNELIGFKATKGLVSTSGVLPACRSLDCVTVFTRTVGLARQVFDVMAAFDPSDAYSRPRPAVVRRPAGRPRIGIPTIDLGLDPVHQKAWEQAISRVGRLFEIVAFEVRPFLAAAQLLYSGPWVAERAVAFGHLLTDAPDIDPSVRQIVSGAAGRSAEDAFRGMYELAELTRVAEPTWDLVDAILLPVTPTHPTLAEVAAEPIAVNTRLGRFTNMTNLLDLAAIAVPGDRRSDGLPFGVQFLAPAWSDEFLLDLGAAWTGEAEYPEHRPAPDGLSDQGSPDDGSPDDGVLIAVAGAHLTGQPLNADLVARGGVFVKTTRTGPGYHMYEVPGPVRRPGLTRLPNGGEMADGIEVEVWRLPASATAGFVSTVLPPLAIGPLDLSDGLSVLGFLCTADAVHQAHDISAYGGWRAYLAASEAPVDGGSRRARSQRQ